MSAKDKVNYEVIQLWLALRELSDEAKNDQSKLPQEDTDLITATSNHSAIRNVLNKALQRLPHP